VNRTPTWAQDQPVSDMVAVQRANEQMQAEVAADKLHSRWVGDLPTLVRSTQPQLKVPV
jgi:hypothetical protein